MLDKKVNKRNIIFDSLLVSIIGFIVLLIISRIFTSIEGPLAVSSILVIVYTVYHGIKSLLFKVKN